MVMIAPAFGKTASEADAQVGSFARDAAGDGRTMPATARPRRNQSIPSSSPAATVKLVGNPYQFQ
jgi:hypothetical protein